MTRQEKNQSPGGQEAALEAEGPPFSTQKIDAAMVGQLAHSGRQPLPPRHAPKSVKNSRTSPKEIKRRERIAEAMEYRRIGYSFPRIADAMGVNQSTAYRMVIDGMQEITREPAVHVLQMELRRIDEIWRRSTRLPPGGTSGRLRRCSNCRNVARGFSVSTKDATRMPKTAERSLCRCR